MTATDFLRKLEAIIDTDTDESELKSMEIFRIFLSTEQKLYLNVEMVIQVLCDAATSMSVESVVESWVSIYEAHSNKHRPNSNERAEKEICVAVNGPLLQHADPILKEALKLMQKTPETEGAGSSGETKTLRTMMFLSQWIHFPRSPTLSLDVIS